MSAKKPACLQSKCLAIADTWALLRRIINEDMLATAERVVQHFHGKPGSFSTTTFFQTPVARLRYATNKLEVTDNAGTQTIIELPYLPRFRNPKASVAAFLERLAPHIDHQPLVVDDEIQIVSEHEDEVSLYRVARLLLLIYRVRGQYSRHQMLHFPGFGTHALWQRTWFGLTPEEDKILVNFCAARIRPRLKASVDTLRVRGDPAKGSFTRIRLHMVQCHAQADPDPANAEPGLYIGVEEEADLQALAAEIGLSVDAPVALAA